MPRETPATPGDERRLGLFTECALARAHRYRECFLARKQRYAGAGRCPAKPLLHQARGMPRETPATPGDERRLGKGSDPIFPLGSDPGGVGACDSGISQPLGIYTWLGYVCLRSVPLQGHTVTGSVSLQGNSVTRSVSLQGNAVTQARDGVPRNPCFTRLGTVSRETPASPGNERGLGVATCIQQRSVLQGLNAVRSPGAGGTGPELLSLLH
jgi:hypothetical protein